MLHDLELAPIELTLTTTPIPVPFQEVISQARELVEAFHLRRWQTPVRGFHASDFELAYRLLAALHYQLPNKQSRRFVEWGSGIPAVAVLADLLGWHPLAIECDPDLFRHAQQWLATRAHDVVLQRASFVPDPLPERLAQIRTNEGVRRSVTDAPALTLEEIRGDVVYAYPWPGEAEFFEQLFLSTALPGDVLVLHHGSLMYDVQQCRRSTNVAD